MIGWGRFPTRDDRSVLLHLHGVRPVGLALEDEDLEVFGILRDEVPRHGLLYVDVLFILPLRLRELQ